jgi:hypothetical protein
MIELHGNAERADTARVKEKIHELSLRYRDKIYSRRTPSNAIMIYIEYNI